MGIETVSHIVAAFVGGSLGIAAMLRNFRSRRCVRFAVLMAALLAFDIFSSLEGVQPQVWAQRGALLAILCTGPAALWFLREIVLFIGMPLRRMLVGQLVFAIPVVLIAMLPSYVKWLPLLFIVAHLGLIFPIGVWLFSLREAAHSVSLTREKLRFRYAFWAGVLALAFFTTDVLNLIGYDNVPPLMTLARVGYLFFIFHTFIQRELVTPQEVIGRLVLFGGITMMLSTIFLILVSWVGDKRDLFFFNTFIASVVIIVLFEPIRNFTAWLTRRFLVKKNSLLEVQLEEMSTNLRGVLEPSEMAKALFKEMSQSVSALRLWFYVLDNEEISYIPLDEEGSVQFEDEIASSSALVEYMFLRGGRPFMMETVQSDRDSFYSEQPRRFCQDCLDLMKKMNIDFVLPFLSEARIQGFCMVRTEEREALSNEQLRLFVPLCRQLAIQLKSMQTLRVLRDRDSLLAAGEMAAGLAHEIKNPLGAIQGAVQLLEGRGEGQSELLTIIRDESSRLSQVLSDFLDYARPRRQEANVNCSALKVVEHTANVVSTGNDVEIEIDGPATSPDVGVDPDMLKQVVLNLMLNAIQAVEPGVKPKISVKVRIAESGRRTVFEHLPWYKMWEGWRIGQASNHQSFVDIEMADNGRGIDPIAMNKIFTPFFTTKPRGTGLGLAVCQRLVQVMGGSISVRPNRPCGTVFTIHLPKTVVREKWKSPNRTQEQVT